MREHGNWLKEFAMKKIHIIVAIVVLVLMLVFGTWAWTVLRDSNENVDLENSSTIESTEPSVPSETGVIEGDVLINGIALNRFFTESFRELLGEPIEADGNFVHYDRFTIAVSYVTENDGYAWQIWPNVDAITINGISFENITRTGIISSFGQPLEYFEYPDGHIFEASVDNNFINYHILKDSIDYILTFRFENWDNPEELTSINIARADLGAA